MSGEETIFEDTMAENFWRINLKNKSPDLRSTIGLNNKHKKKPISRHIVIELQNTNTKEKIFNAF